MRVAQVTQGGQAGLEARPRPHAVVLAGGDEAVLLVDAGESVPVAGPLEARAGLLQAPPGGGEGAHMRWTVAATTSPHARRLPGSGARARRP